MSASIRAALVGVAVLAAGCGESARLSVDATSGPTPELVEPNTTLIPTLNFADAEGWAPGQTPTAAAGLTVTRFADGFEHPRWIYVLPNDDVLVAESNAPAEAGIGGLRGWIERYFKKKAGVAGESADRITLLRDSDADGLVEQRTTFLSGLASPFGMALVGDRLYVANSGSLVSFPYTPGATAITAMPDTVALLPTGSVNQHWTRSLLASPDGATLYVGVGSASNVGEHGLDEEIGRAAIWAVDVATGTTRIYADGLRNPVGMDWGPDGRLWTAVNERDALGSDLVPDYLTAVADGDFFGWPYSYWGDIVDTRVEPRPDRVAAARVPDYALGAHTASLGLAWSDGATVGLGRGMLVGQHGSWNRRPKSGYKVVLVPFAGDAPAGLPVDVLTGFLSDDEEIAYGRPVGVVLDASGALLVADDVGDVIWRVAPSR